MAEIYFDVDMALAEVPINKVPLVDASDGTTIEDALVYNEAGMDLNWNFVTSAGAFTQTNVIPTTAGVHDWVNQGNGMYTLEIPSSAGTINNDTEGYGWFTGICTATLLWTSPIFGFRAAALNDALLDGGDMLDVNVVNVADTAQTAADIGLNTKTSSDGIILGACGSTSLTVTTCSSDLTGYTADQLNGRWITFLGGAADGESTDITGYAVTNGVLTFTALTIAPGNTDPFKIT